MGRSARSRWFGCLADVLVFQEYGQAGFPTEHVVQGLGQRVAGHQAAVLQLIPAPLEEVTDHRLGVIQPVLTLLLAGQPLGFDDFFIPVQLGDLLQGLGDGLRVIFLRLDK